MMRYLSLSGLSLCLGLAGLMPLTAQAEGGIASACVGQIDGYFYPTTVPGIGLCSTAGEADSCNQTFSNFCFDGKVQSIFIYQTCTKIACRPAVSSGSVAAGSVATAAAETSSTTVSFDGAGGVSSGGGSSGSGSSSGGSSGGGQASTSGSSAASGSSGSSSSSGDAAAAVVAPVLTNSSGSNASGGLASTVTLGTPVITAPIVVAPVVTPTVAVAPGHNLIWGINAPSYISDQYVAAFKVMNERGLKTYRINVNLTADNPTAADKLGAMQLEAAKAGITLKPLLYLQYQWADSMTAPRKATVDRVALYNDAYARTYAITERFRYDIQDWEMGNEINLRTRYDNGGADINPPDSWYAATYDTPRLNDWAMLVKGQADAIADVNKKYGTHLRRVLNTTGLAFGFLDFMASKGVEFDVISYHYYEHIGRDMNNFWNGPLPKVSLFKSLAKYNKPVIINETNCAEIYDAGYDNKLDGNLTNTCMQSFNNILTQIENQTDANIEGVQGFEIVDVPTATPIAETRFGMMVDLKTPKLNLAVLSLHTGGLVTDAEHTGLVRAGVLSK